MLAEKKSSLFTVNRTKPHPVKNVAPEKKAHVVSMPASLSRRGIEKVSSKGYIAAPKHDFL